jgi:AraC family transcriptional regulator of adaptative response/methylated-DNA-[protein]-cysteine methyltransferase
VHVSPFHLQRLFKRVVGVSPRQYQAAQRGAALRDALKRGTNVTRATVDAGFSSPSRMYDTAPAELGMAPSAYRRKGAGLVVRHASASTPLGTVLVAATDRGICKIAFGDDKAELVDGLREEFANAELVEDTQRLAPFVAQIDAYLRGSEQCVDLPLDIAPTAFQQRVWDALRRIPYGETRSYSEIAEAVGSPQAVRAVAGACASNPVALAIPCHRVLHKDGSLSGYRWGAERKAALLDAERQHGDGASHAAAAKGKSTSGASTAAATRGTATSTTATAPTHQSNRTADLDHAA